MLRSPFSALATISCLFGAFAAQAASHREAPLTAVDRLADITDFYAFVSPDSPDTATLIVAVDPLLEPANGPNYFPFGEDILYAIRIDNDNDAVEDVVFEFRFRTEIRAPGVPVGLIGAGGGVPAPDNSPDPVAPGAPLIPPAITALDGPGSEGFNLRQSYSVRMCMAPRGARDSSRSCSPRWELERSGGKPLFAVPSNAGPRTMPDYASLVQQGIYDLEQGIRVFAGTTDDAFYIDLGAAFDSLNFRVIPGATSTGVSAVLSEAQDAADDARLVPDDVSGYNVNTIAIQVPIRLLTRDGSLPDAGDTEATIGTWGTTSRRKEELRRDERPVRGQGSWVQVQRMANPLFNELLIGTGAKDRWSRSQPQDDAQFADFALDPLIARVAQAAYGGAFDIPVPPRFDLLPLVTYAPPIAAPGTEAGPIADLLRLNVGVAPTPFADASRLGVLGGDPAGFPNGRRPLDDVTDIVLRVVVGGVLTTDANGNPLNRFPNNRLGDGVNTNEMPRVGAFPFIAPAHDGRNSRHIDPAEPGCDGGGCPVD